MTFDSKSSTLFYRSLYFYAHIWCLLLILFCRNSATRMRTRPKETPAKTDSAEENKNWIYKLEHKGASVEINNAKRLKLN